MKKLLAILIGINCYLLPINSYGGGEHISWMYFASDNDGNKFYLDPTKLHYDQQFNATAILKVIYKENQVVKPFISNTFVYGYYIQCKPMIAKTVKQAAIINKTQQIVEIPVNKDDTSHFDSGTILDLVCINIEELDKLNKENQNEKKLPPNYKFLPKLQVRSVIFNEERSTTNFQIKLG